MISSNTYVTWRLDRVEESSVWLEEELKFA